MSARTSSYNFKEVEEGVIEFWEKNQTYPKIKKKGEGKQKFFFIQGPPYTSGRIHMGHAWNNSLKDLVLRYKRMKGFDVFDRAAYDMHGLPTERKAMELHKLKDKEEIEKFGMEKFIKECIKWSVEKAKLMDQDLWRLGVWMDYPNARYPIDNSYVEGVWFLIKKTHENGRLYEGLRTMSWCATCQTAMAKHECEYKEVKEPSIFVKFPVKGKENEYVIIWTTTPWTIAYNLAIMVHPELPYVKAKVGDEIWILAKQLAAPVIQSFTDHKLEVLDEFPGKELEGLEYEHPWNKKWDHYKEIKAKHPKAHTVILSEEYVDVSAGTGLVHCAPGCGPEDYEVGHRNNIPPFNNLHENGLFPEGMAEFSGLTAKKDDMKFVEAMKNDGILVATTEVEHDYAHCERCHSPVIFRTTKQWFFKVEDLKERMVKANEKIYWIPDAGKNSFRSWLENLRDNSITKQRFWGTPAPIWKCASCGKYEVIGSALELKDKAGHCPESLHKPWIDEVEISCDCGDKMKRLPDVLDVWIDAGTLSWNILDYPSDEEKYKKLWPADFILEAKEQVRGWFNMLMVTSILALDDPLPFKSCYMHGMLTDVEGQKMSKSLGNVISPYEVIDKHGADTLRLYTTGVTAGEDMNFSWEEIKLRHRNLSVLWNTHRYLIEQCKLYGLKPEEKVHAKNLDEVDRYILSKTHSTLKKVTESLEKYQLHEIPSAVTEMFLELSRTYIQMTRDRANSEDAEERKTVLDTIYHSMLCINRMMAPLCPFITEQMHLNLKEEFGLKNPSVHDCDWPEADEKLIDKGLEKQFDIVKTAIQAMLSAREKAQTGVRWPITEAVVVTKDADNKKAVENLAELIKKQTNIKKVTVADQFDKVKLTLKADYTKMGPSFGEKSGQIVAKIATMSPESILSRIEKEGHFIVESDGEKFELTREHIIIKREVPDSFAEGEFRNGLVYLDLKRTPELEAEGYARELMRRIQALRKDAKLSKPDRISLFIRTDQETVQMLKPWNDAIKEKVGASQMNITHNEPAKMHQHKKKEKIKEKEFVVEFDKL
ncbi:isoleucine--tRNA ligase [Candidatus Woesearchaeota archaeon]|nr:isoleucine--tRNA ligase [Candidatus Woesearchaeota archaeon]